MAHDLNDAIRFGFLVQDVARLRRVMIDRALKPLAVTRSQWWVLTFLSRRDGMTQSALASDLDLTKVAIGGLLNRMETSGLVERRADDTDARIRRVYLTRTGNRLIAQIRKQVERFEHEMLGASTDAEMETTLLTLRRMKRKLLQMIGDDEAVEGLSDLDLLPRTEQTAE